MSRLSDTDRSGWPGMLTAQDRRGVLSETVVTGLTKYSASTVAAVPAVLSFESGEADATRGRVGGVHDSDSPPCVHAPLLRSRGIK